VTPLTVPSPDHDLPWLHIDHHLLLCPACGSRCHSVPRFCADILLLTSGQPRYHHRLDILVADTWIRPSGQAPFCTLSTHLNANFPCVLANLVGFEDSPLGIPADTRTCCWLDIIAVTAYAMCALRLPP
jgi:hypothetical protein